MVEKLRAWLAARGEVEPDELLFPISARAGVTVTRDDGSIYYRRHANGQPKKAARQSQPPVPERKTLVMMREDMAAARRVWIAEAKDGKERRKRDRSDFLAYCNHAGLYADFHSNRHTFITNLCKADVSPKTAQTLARHSDIRLTMDVYTHVDRDEQIDAIRKLRAPDDNAA